MSFRAGERYRLGFSVKASGPERDDWTGTTVELVEPWLEPGYWRCRRSGQSFIVVSEQRLGGSARLAD